MILPLRPFRLLFISGVVLLTGRCADGAPPRFTLLDPAQTGVTFANTITTTDSVNVQTDSFVYNGGGVAVGDIDNDGRPDIFLTGNMVSSRLYLNQGGMQFADITEAAGVTTTRWATGASLVDIDADGYLDIYVSVSGPEWTPPEDRANLLFLNNGDSTFTEAAAAYGVADPGFTTHAAFFDYDGDGDLDLFLLTNSPAEFARGEAERHPAGLRSTSSESYDHLYRNNGDGSFVDASEEAGILREVGFGLGVVVTDLNDDGWPDLYVSNDDTPSDVLYVNNGDGTFTDRAGEWLKHTSFAGMGIDIADFNNDGWPDILQTDMMPEGLAARKRMTGAETYRGAMERRRRGFHPDFNMNSLQLHNGVLPDGSISFSEISRLAGLAYTDWSWSALFGDYDNDGYKDILITNGYPKAVVDFDYQFEMHGVRRRGDDQRALDILSALGSYEVSNYVFRNEGDLTFTNRTVEWGLNRAGFSYGTARADLDNDGRLDLVINNLDAPASIYHNAPPDQDTSHFLEVILDGSAPNRRGIGSKLTLWAGGRKQFIYHTPYRGFMSSMDDRIHFGLGPAVRVDSLAVAWPDGREQRLIDLPVDEVVTVRQEDAVAPEGGPPPPPLPVFRPAEPARTVAYEHRERALVDYSVQALLPYQLSRQGPPLTVGDVTGNGLDDVFVGGAAGSPGVLFLQQSDGRFVPSTDGQPWLADQEHEDWGALFFDADGDGQLDLYVASGGYQFSPASDLLQDRLYLNRGDARFVRDTVALPQMLTSTAAVSAGDLNGDGRPDLFVGGRLTPRDYPRPTRSYVLRNEGGRFVDVTEEVNPELVEPGGMVTDAVWMDFTGDGRPDLVTAGVWMPVRFYANDGDRLRDVTDAAGLPPMRGWWYRLDSGDFNGDGRPDLIAGNLGLNLTFTTSPERRFGVYADDFTGNRTTDIVFTEDIDGKEYPFYGLAKLGDEIYTVGLKFPTFAAFSTASVQDIFGVSQLERAVHYQADTFASVVLLNEGNGSFTSSHLPTDAQIAPINASIVHDVDGDGNLDLIVAGNLYETEANTARADAGRGLWLRGDGHGNFVGVPPAVSGFVAPGQVMDLALVNTASGEAVLVANNNDSLQTFAIVTR